MKTVVSILLFLVVAFQGNSQITSPSIASAEGLFRSNLYSGAADVNIPLYNFASRDVSVPITLYYTSGTGVRVNEEASWVGLGWYLQAGGFITQNIQGYNDFHPDGGYLTSPKTFPCLTGSSTVPFPDNKDCFGAASTATFLEYQTTDTEPDIYILSMPGYNVRFFYDKQKNIFHFERSPLVIKFDNVTSKIFTVTTPDGFDYYFHMLSDAIDIDATDERYRSKGFTWYLTSIVSKATGEKVDFEYYVNPTKDAFRNVFTNSYLEKYNDYAALFSGFPPTNPPNPYASDITNCIVCNCVPVAIKETPEEGFYFQCNGYETREVCPKRDNRCTSITGGKTTLVKTKWNTVWLKRIKGSQGFVRFEPGTRNDIGSVEPRLSALKAYAYTETIQDSTLITHWDFFHSYFQSSEANHYSFAYPYGDTKRGLRLKLDSIAPGGTNPRMPSYSFGYHLNVTLPYKSSLGIDHWGYYNGATYNQALVGPNNSVNRASNINFGTASILKWVRTPLGKQTLFEYESSGAGVRVSSILESEAYSKSRITKYLYENTPVIVPSYRLSGLGIYLNWPYTGFPIIYKSPNGDVPFCYPYSYFRCMYYIVSSSVPTSFSNMSSIPPVNHTKITELLGVNGENGKTEYYYPTMSYSNPAYPFVPMAQNSLEGKMNRKIVYKNVGGDFQKLQEQTFAYYYYTNATTANGIRSYFDNNSQSNQYLGYKLDESRLSKTAINTFTYDQNDQTKCVRTRDTTSYQFGTFLPAYTMSEVVGSGRKNSRNLENTFSLIEGWKIPVAPGSEMALTSPFLPLQSVNLSYRSDHSGPYNINSEVNHYNPNGTLKEKWISNESVGNCSYTAQGVLTKDPKYRQVLKNGYKRGNLVQQDVLLKENQSGGYNATFSSNATIWGYRHSLPIASVSNADTTQIAYNGFETATLYGESGWNGDPTGKVLVKKATEPGNVFSGNYAIKLLPATSPSSPNFSPYTIIKPWFQMGKYKFSCWMKLSQATSQDNAFLEIKTIYQNYFGAPTFPSVAHAYRIKYADRTLTDWQYVEVILDFDEVKLSSPSTTLFISVVAGNKDAAATLYVDDMRLHPLDAQMTTFTYAPGRGKTSEAGADSKPIHYEYDIYGRLIYIRDFRGNIVKRNQYFLK